MERDRDGEKLFLDQVASIHSSTFTRFANKRFGIKASKYQKLELPACGSKSYYEFRDIIPELCSRQFIPLGRKVPR